MSNELGEPAKIIVFSRDEASHTSMRLDFQQRAAATDEIIYRNFQQLLEFRIGDVRDYSSVASVLRDVDVVFNAAAMKQVPTCEISLSRLCVPTSRAPKNIVRAIQEHTLMVETVVGISTDKACKPVNTMGITKALQERIFIQANMRCPGTRFVCVRYGNVLASRGSVVPLFHDQIAHGGAGDDHDHGYRSFPAEPGRCGRHRVRGTDGSPSTGRSTFRAPPRRAHRHCRALIGERDIKTVVTGIRPGEKIHEIMVSDEETPRAMERGRWYALLPMLPEICGERTGTGCLTKEYSSNDTVMNLEETIVLLKKNHLMLEDIATPAPNVFSGYQGESCYDESDDDSRYPPGDHPIVAHHRPAGAADGARADSHGAELRLRTERGVFSGLGDPDPAPSATLDAAGRTPAETIGKVIAKADEALERERPEAVLLLGDTNSCLAAIAAKRRHIPIFHMEAAEPVLRPART